MFSQIAAALIVNFPTIYPYAGTLLPYARELTAHIGKRYVTIVDCSADSLFGHFLQKSCFRT